MTTLVVDASVVVKWFIPEAWEETADRLRSPGYTCIAPAHWRLEVMNALWKKLVVRQEITRSEFDAASALAFQLELESVPANELLPAALDFAVSNSRTVYDSLYIALAQREQCQFVTADLRLYNAIRPTLPELMLWVGDILPG